MYCKNCGTKNQMTDNFCTNCSNPITFNKINHSSSEFIHLNTINHDIYYENIKNNLKKHSTKLISTILIIIIGISIYKLFFAPNPKKDAIKLSQLITAYEAKKDSFQIEAYKSFNQSIDNNKYKDRNEANKELEITLSNATNYTLNDENKIKILSKEIEDRYLNDQIKYHEYETEFNNQEKIKINRFKNELETIKNTTNNKINTITGATPSEENIYNDLINVNLMNIFTIDYIRQIENIKILSSNVYNNYLELVANIQVIDESSTVQKKFTFKNVILQYYLDDNGNWKYRENSCYQYDMQLLLKYEWYTVQIPNNAQFSINCHGQLGYARENGFWSWGEKIEIGGSNYVKFKSNQIQFASHSKDEQLNLTISITKYN